MGRRRKWEPNPETIFEDLLAAISDNRYTRKGDKRTPEEIERWRAAWHATRGAKRQAATAKAAERQKREKQARDARRRRPRFPAYGERDQDLILKVMEPGEWYGTNDLLRLIGADKNARLVVRRNMAPAGLIERAANPRWDARDVLSFSGEREPRWLWRLTEAGETLRAEMLSRLS